MKKVLKLVVFMFVFFAGMNIVMAQGPKSDGYIKVVTYTRDNETATYLYSKTETIQTINGISYDEQSNILTLNNYSAEGVSIQIHNMGDFKINVIGSNVINSYYKTAIDVTGNNSTTVYGGGSISFSSYRGIKTDTGILNIENVSLSNKIDEDGYLIISEGKVNIENSTLSFDFFYDVYSYVILGNDDITIENSNISGNAGFGIVTGWNDEKGNKGNISIINSTIDLAITSYMKKGISTDNNINIENSTIKIDDGGIYGRSTTNVSNSNIDIKIENGHPNNTTGISGINLNINDSNLNVDTTGTSCFMGKNIIINGGTTKLKSSDAAGIRISNFYDEDFYDEDNLIGSLTIKKGSIDITAFAGIGFDFYRDEGSIANFTMENGKLVINALSGIGVTNANFKGGYVEIDASNKDGIFGEEPGIGTVLATESINLASNVEASNNAKVYKLDDGEGFSIYYLNDEEVEYDEENTFSKPLLKNVIIKDKNYTEEEITPPKKEEITPPKEEITTTKAKGKNDVVENPKTADISINAVLPLLLVIICFVLIGIQKLKEINNK